MADIVSQEKRSRMMSGIRSRNTRIELLIRKGLHSRGLRYRLHLNTLPGKPDLVLPKYRAVVFVHGCFWHMHDCGLFREPATNTEFWVRKISANRENDIRNAELLMSSGWRVLTVWECSIRGKQKSIDEVLDQVISWLRADQKKGEIRG